MYSILSTIRASRRIFVLGMKPLFSESWVSFYPSPILHSFRCILHATPFYRKSYYLYIVNKLFTVHFLARNIPYQFEITSKSFYHLF